MLAAVFGEPALVHDCFAGCEVPRGGKFSTCPKLVKPERTEPRHASPSGCAGGWGHDGEARWKRATVSILREAGGVFRWTGIECPTNAHTGLSPNDGAKANHLRAAVAAGSLPCVGGRFSLRRRMRAAARSRARPAGTAGVGWLGCRSGRRSRRDPHGGGSGISCRSVARCGTACS